jgi:hypothetical protein
MKIVKDCEVQEITTFLIIKPDFREVFSILEINKGMLDFLKKKHEKKMLRHL